MLPWQVYILSRMGNSHAALALIIEQRQDIPRAIEFVRLQRDDELWEELIDWALRSADTTGGAGSRGFHHWGSCPCTVAGHVENLLELPGVLMAALMA
jgi:hypothetical protein